MKSVVKRIMYFLFLILIICITAVTVFAHSGNNDGIGELYSAEKTHISISFPDYENGIVNGRDTGYIQIVEKDGRKSVKVTPNPESTQSTSTVVDGYSYSSAGVDLEQYRWFAVEYYYESPNPVKNMRMNLAVLTYGGVLKPDTSSVASNSQSVVSANKWDIAVFDMTKVKNHLNPDSETHILKQMHFCPFGTNNIKNKTTTKDDIMYISKMMFFKENPNLVSHPAYISGYEDGTFRPGNLLSRAEGCAIAARIIADEQDIDGNSPFKDVSKDSWYAKYIGFCFEKGLLDSYSDKFEPEKPISKKEFSALVISAYSLYGNEKLAISKDGEIFEPTDKLYGFSGTNDGVVSRAQAVSFVNAVRGNIKTSEDIDYKYEYLFVDVTNKHMLYADIAQASIPHVEENGKWIYTVTDHFEKLCETVGYDYFYDLKAGKEKIAELDVLEAKRIEEIKNTPNMDVSDISGKKIYVSPYGNDTNSGLNEDSPVKTLTKANSLVSSGDVVLLERGGEWREKIIGKKGVTYTAYGTGAKPILNGSVDNGADSKKWTLVYEDSNTGSKIWKYHYEDWLDVGEIVFNEGEGYALKDLPDCTTDGKYVVYGNRQLEYDYTKELDKNFEFFHNISGKYTSDGYIDCNNSKGELYLRCDNGNPGKVFRSIEFVTRGANITCSGNTNVTVDNLCFKYSNFGISAGTTNNLTVTNCEFYWIGGSIQTYSMRSGVATRYGNAIEIYGGVDGYLVDNCYFYEIYDAAVTHQVGEQDQNLKMDNITYSNNVMDKCQYSIEYFFGGAKTAGSDVVRNGTNILFEGNLCRRAGYGYGSTRRDVFSQRHIRSGGSRNEFYNFRIENNIFDRSVYELTQTTCTLDETRPTFDGNIYIQGIGNRIFSHGVGRKAYADILAEQYIKDMLGDKNAKFYFTEYIPQYKWEAPKT